MSADRARLTYYPPRKYREVLSQQGRVLLEADLNEQRRTSTEESRHEALDFVGPAGTPDDGYLVAGAGSDFTIGPGTMYVGGLRTTLEVSENYSAQPDWLDTVEVAPWGEGLWRTPDKLVGTQFEAALLLREQEIVTAEDPSLKDAALGGPDSAARTRLLQRVVAIETKSATCAGAAADATNFWSSHGLIYDPATAELQSRALLQITPVTNAPPPSPCDPPSATGYLGADNQMLRVMVTSFDPGTNSGVLLWSYNNASTLYRCVVQTATTVQLAARPISAEYQPRAGQVVQILQRAADLGEGAFAAALTGHFAKLTAPYAPDTQLVVLPAAMPQPPYANGANVYLRLWEDQVNFTLGTAVVLAGTGLQVTITGGSAGPLHLGDYWSLAARPLTPNTIYPERLLTTPQPPDGPRMWACPLAVVDGIGGGFNVLEDCRLPFDNLVGLTARKSGDCCCIKVSPAQAKDLQGIIDRASSGGLNGSGAAQVVIELEAGIYLLAKPLQIGAKHLGLVITACTAGKPILRAAEPNAPDFSLGLISVTERADLTLRGLEFDLPLAPAENVIVKVASKRAPKQDWNPRSISFGIRTLDCDSLQVEDCYFRFQIAEASYGAGIFVQGNTINLSVRRSTFIGAQGVALSVYTGILAAPFVASRQTANLQPTSIDFVKIDDCAFGFLSFAILLAGQVRYAWASGNATRSVSGAFYLISLSTQFSAPSDVLAYVPDPSVDPDGKAAEMVTRIMNTADLNRALGTGMLIGSTAAAAKISKSTGPQKSVTLPSKAATHGGGLVLTNVANSLTSKLNFAASTATDLPFLCLTLQGNQFDCRPLAAQSESIAGVFIFQTDIPSCFANVTGNTIWNRSQPLPALLMVTLAGFNVTGNILTGEFANALWVQPGPTVQGAGGVEVKMMTITGNTIFGRTNLQDLPRPEWRSAPKGLDTWEFFNTLSI